MIVYDFIKKKHGRLMTYILLIVYTGKAWKRMVTKVTFVGEGFTRKPAKFERFIRPMVSDVWLFVWAVIGWQFGGGGSGQGSFRSAKTRKVRGNQKSVFQSLERLGI